MDSMITFSRETRSQGIQGCGRSCPHMAVSDQSSQLCESMLIVRLSDGRGPQEKEILSPVKSVLTRHQSPKCGGKAHSLEEAKSVFRHQTERRMCEGNDLGEVYQTLVFPLGMLWT